MACVSRLCRRASAILRDPCRRVCRVLRDAYEELFVYVCVCVACVRKLCRRASVILCDPCRRVRSSLCACVCVCVCVCVEFGVIVVCVSAGLFLSLLLRELCCLDSVCIYMYIQSGPCHLAIVFCRCLGCGVDFSFLYSLG